MGHMQYFLLTEVFGCWKAVAGSTQQTSFRPVKIYVPKAGLRRARALLKSFDEI
jgi:hypothetical protein